MERNPTTADQTNQKLAQYVSLRRSRQNDARKIVSDLTHRIQALKNDNERLQSESEQKDRELEAQQFRHREELQELRDSADQEKSYLRDQLDHERQAAERNAQKIEALTQENRELGKQAADAEDARKEAEERASTADERIARIQADAEERIEAVSNEASRTVSTRTARFTEKERKLVSQINEAKAYTETVRKDKDREVSQKDQELEQERRLVQQLREEKEYYVLENQRITSMFRSVDQRVDAVLSEEMSAGKIDNGLDDDELEQLSQFADGASSGRSQREPRPLPRPLPDVTETVRQFSSLD